MPMESPGSPASVHDTPAVVMVPHVVPVREVPGLVN